MYFKFAIKRNFEHISDSKERELICNLEDGYNRKLAHDIINYATDNLANHDDVFLISYLYDIHEYISDKEVEKLNEVQFVELGDYTLYVEESSKEEFDAWLAEDDEEEDVNWLQSLLDQYSISRYRLSKMTGIAESQLGSIVNSNVKKENVKYGHVKLIEDAFNGKLGSMSVPSFQPAEDIYCPKCLRRYFKDQGKVLAYPVYESERDDEEKLARVSCDYCGKSYVVSIKNNLMCNLYPKEFFKRE